MRFEYFGSLYIEAPNHGLDVDLFAGDGKYISIDRHTGEPRLWDEEELSGHISSAAQLVCEEDFVEAEEEKKEEKGWGSWTHGNSSVIRYYRYNLHSKELEIEFVTAPGVVYRYYQVPLSVVLGFDRAGSRGQYFNDRIKGQYDNTFTTYDYVPF